MLIIGLDTETCNGFIDADGKLNLTQSLVYDLGWAVIETETGLILEEKSYIIGDVFCELKEAMESAYYANKIPMYWQDWRTGNRKISNFMTVRRDLLNTFKRYEIKGFFAHNAFFDLNALNNTLRYITKSKYRYFFPYCTEILDTLKFARRTICKNGEYIEFCESNNYMTAHKKPRPRATAEILYRYLTQNNDFVESHTGLEDVKIEKEILRYLVQKYPDYLKELQGRD